MKKLLRVLFPFSFDISHLGKYTTLAFIFGTVSVVSGIVLPIFVLIDNRFAEPVYRELMPSFWHGLKYAGDLPALTRRLTQFWHPKDNT